MIELERTSSAARVLAVNGLCAAIILSLALAVIPDVLLTFFPLWFVHGYAVALYGPLLRAAGPARGRVGFSILLAAAGFTHLFWVLLLTPTLLVAGELASMMLTTGVGFGLLLTIDLRSLRAVLIMLAGTGASVAAAEFGPFWPSGTPLVNEVGFPAMFLHLGIALTLFDAARRSWPKLPGVCAVCGYPLAGLPGGRCPECGAALKAGPARAGASA